MTTTPAIAEGRWVLDTGRYWPPPDEGDDGECVACGETFFACGAAPTDADGKHYCSQNCRMDATLPVEATAEALKVYSAAIVISGSSDAFWRHLAATTNAPVLTVEDVDGSKLHLDFMILRRAAEALVSFMGPADDWPSWMPEEAK